MAKNKSLSADEALKIAEKAAAGGDKEKAMKYYDAVLAKYPDNKDAWEGVRRINPGTLFRADIDELEGLLKEGKAKEVEVKTKMYMELYQEAYELVSLLGVSLAMQNKLDEAMPYLKKATELKPLNFRPFFNLANGYKAIGDFPNAVSHYRRALEIKPDNVEALNNLGNVFMRMKEYDQAASTYRKAVNLAPDVVPLLVNAGRAFKEKGEYLGAIVYFERAISINGRSADIFLDLATCQKLHGNIDEAINIYDVITNEDPENVNAHNNYANLLHELGEYDRAISHFERAIEIDPNNVLPYRNLSILYRELGDFDKLSENLNRLKRTFPNAAGIIFEIAELQKACGDYEAAKQSYEDIFRQLPRGPVIITNLVILNFLSGDLENAVRYLEMLDDELISVITDQDKRKTCEDYKKLLVGLVAGFEKTRLKNAKDTMFVLGDSVAIAASGQNVNFNDTSMLLQSKWIEGCKVSHFQGDANNQYKEAIRRNLAEIEEQSHVVFLFGGRSFRDGLEDENEKLAKDHAEQSAKDYFEAIRVLSEEAKVEPVFCSIAAPVFGDDKKDIDLVDAIRTFNEELRKNCIEHNAKFADVFALTDTGDGYADGKKHMDENHVRPEVIVAALNA